MKRITIAIICLLFCSMSWAAAEDGWESETELVPLERIAELVEPYRPSLMKRIRAWMDQYPDMAPRIHAHISELYHDGAGHVAELRELTEREPEMAEQMRREIVMALTKVEGEMAVGIKTHLAEQASGAEREKLMKELRVELESLFDQKVAERQLQIRNLENELAEIRAQVSEAMKMREAIIERKLAEVGGGPDVFEW